MSCATNGLASLTNEIEQGRAGNRVRVSVLEWRKLSQRTGRNAELPSHRPVKRWAGREAPFFGNVDNVAAHDWATHQI